MRDLPGASRSAARPRKGRIGLHLAAGLFISVFGYAASIQAALPPGAEIEAKTLAPQLKPVLSAAGADTIITGSISPLFTTSVFVGPNSAEKQGRARKPLDPVAIASVLGAFHHKLLAVKMPHEALLAEAKEEPVTPSATPMALDAPIAVASISVDPRTAAFDAIREALRLDPAPVDAPGALAYARAVAPPSLFDTPVAMRVADKQFQCLAEAVYFEARSEPYRGQAAVAQVVLNRVKSKLYPSTICGVVYQNQSWRNACQFSFACDGIPERVTEPEAWKTAKEVAEKVLRGEIYLTEVANATHYHASYVHPVWAKELKRMTKIGLHIFYRFRGATT